MYLLGCAVFLLIANLSTSSEYSDIEEAFTSFLITPFVIPVVPPRELSARFYAHKIKLGNKIPVYGTVNPPVVYYEANPDVLHTIVILDADSPSALAPLDSQTVHALLINIPGNNLAQCEYATPYRPTAPSPGSGYHRFVILLYRQTRWIDVDSPDIQKINSKFINFSVTNFSAQHGLGYPIAGNFFLTQLSICDDDEAPDKCEL